MVVALQKLGTYVQILFRSRRMLFTIILIFLDLSTRGHFCTFTSHNITPKEAGTGCTLANFDYLSTPVHDVENYRVSDRANFSKQLKYVLPRIVNGPKQPSTRPKFCVRWNGYESNADRWESINHIPRSHILFYCKRKKTKIAKEIDCCIACVLTALL